MPAIELNPEQLQMVKIIHDHALRFPLNETGEAQLLQTCYDYMDAFKRVMDSTSTSKWIISASNTMAFTDSAKLMERMAQGIADGIIEVPKIISTHIKLSLNTGRSIRSYRNSPLHLATMGICTVPEILSELRKTIRLIAETPSLGKSRIGWIECVELSSCQSCHLLCRAYAALSSVRSAAQAYYQ